MVRIQYNVPVEDWVIEIAKEKERVQMENCIKELSCIAFWKERNVTIPKYSSASLLQESDDYIFEFIIYGRLRSMIYARRNDANTVDIITTML